MSYNKINFGIIAEYGNQKISIFNTDSLTVIKQIPITADVIDVALTSNGRRAVVSSFITKTIYQVDLWDIRHPIIIHTATAPTYLEDIELTPDNRFALSVDGSASNQDIVSYSLEHNNFISALPTIAQAVAISPKGSGLVLTAKYDENVVRVFRIDHEGILTDTGLEFPAGGHPININFSPDDNFAFVSDTPNAISVLSTIFPDNISLISTVPASASNQPQSMAITRNGRYIFSLGLINVDIYNFDPVSGNLTLARSFAHGLNIRSFYGVDQIALDHDEKKLFISGQGQVAVFTTYGIKLGTVTGVEGPGGLDIGTRMGYYCTTQPYRHLSHECNQEE